MRIVRSNGGGPRRSWAWRAESDQTHVMTHVMTHVRCDAVMPMRCRWGRCASAHVRQWGSAPRRNVKSCDTAPRT
eukprot:7382466-Prymnesium_polylepis.1